jgi:hypothetical protein
LCKVAFALLTGVSLAVACSVDHADMAMPACSGLNCSDPGPPSNAQDVPTSVSGAADASVAPDPEPAKEACGVGSCMPDDASECRDYEPPPQPDQDTLDAGVGDAGSTPEGDAGLDAGGPNIDGNFTQPEPPASGPPRFACQLALGKDSKVSRACGVAGSQTAEQACTSSLDCAPGLGCVGAFGSGRCLPFCCGVGPDSCAEGFYCAERPLRSETLGEVDGPLVPVCDRADNCSLGESKDCTGPRCLCGPDMACTLVRPDGTTSCVQLPDPEERGQQGDPCPCDRGFHCSQATEPAQCVKTCDLDEDDSDTCGAGVCQASPVLPAGWGVCVGATSEEMPGGY